jgi:hypothetical protein
LASASARWRSSRMKCVRPERPHRNAPKSCIGVVSLVALS